MSNLVKHAQTELALIKSSESIYGDSLTESVLEMVEVFSKQGHSGMSAALVVGMLDKLLRFEPLSPLTGEADEWNEVCDGMLQNKRCGHVFKDPSRFNGQAYDGNGKVFVDPEGGSYTSSESGVPIKFPYTPTTEYIHRKAA